MKLGGGLYDETCLRNVAADLVLRIEKRSLRTDFREDPATYINIHKILFVFDFICRVGRVLSLHSMNKGMFNEQTKERGR